MAWRVSQTPHKPHKLRFKIRHKAKWIWHSLCWSVWSEKAGALADRVEVLQEKQSKALRKRDYHRGKATTMWGES